jgi:hypothetical protein
MIVKEIELSKGEYKRKLEIWTNPMRRTNPEPCYQFHCSEKGGKRLIWNTKYKEYETLAEAEEAFAASLEYSIGEGFKERGTFIRVFFGE